MPNLTLAEVTKLVCDYVNAEFAKIKTKSKMTVEMVHGGEPWVVSFIGLGIIAARFVRLPYCDTRGHLRPTPT